MTWNIDKSWSILINNDNLPLTFRQSHVENALSELPLFFQDRFDDYIIGSREL